MIVGSKETVDNGSPTMATHSFRDRFIGCLSPLQLLLTPNGIFVDVELRHRKIYCLIIASLLFFAARVSADIHFFYLTLFELLKMALSNKQKGFPGFNEGFTRIDAIGYVLDKLSSSWCHVFTYILLMITGRQTILMFCASLERTDQSSGRPDLSLVRKRNAIAVTWTLSMVLTKKILRSATHKIQIDCVTDYR